MKEAGLTNVVGPEGEGREEAGTVSAGTCQDKAPRRDGTEERNGRAGKGGDFKDWAPEGAGALWVEAREWLGDGRGEPDAEWGGEGGA